MRHLTLPRQTAGSDLDLSSRIERPLVITTIGVFDLYDLGALVGKRHGGKRPRDHRRQIDDPKSVQGSWHLIGLPSGEIGATAQARRPVCF